jgi:hypothetical protein
MFSAGIILLTLESDPFDREVGREVHKALIIHPEEKHLHRDLRGVNCRIRPSAHIHRRSLRLLPL